MSVRRLLVATLAVGAVAAAAVTGCGAPPSEHSESSSEAVTSAQCSQMPFDHYQCLYLGLGGSSGGGGGSGSSGGIKLQSVTPLHDETLLCSCLPTTYSATATTENAAVSCYRQTGALVPAPPPPLAGCTAGVVMTGVDYNGMLYANTWVCPSSYLGQIPTNLGAAPTCDGNPYALGPQNSTMPAGDTQCEWVYAGTSLNSGSDCLGDPHQGWLIVQERVFGTTLQPLPSGGHHVIGLACNGGCCVPDGTPDGDGGTVPPPIAD
ncbi:MAG TPA: hypothetical protein VGI39_11910 [Polyangiaceae bacterium]|jgi:hypothetical protein